MDLENAHENGKREAQQQLRSESIDELRTSILHDLRADEAWFIANYRSIRREYRNNGKVYVAVARGRVIAAGRDFGTISEEVRSAGGPPWYYVGDLRSWRVPSPVYARGHGLQIG